MQATCQQLQCWKQGSRMPWSPSPLSCPGVALSSVHVSLPRTAPMFVPAVPHKCSHVAGTGCWEGNMPGAGRSAGQLSQSQQPSHRQPLLTSVPSLLQPLWVPRVPHTPSQRRGIEIGNLDKFFIINSWFCHEPINIGCTSLITAGFHSQALYSFFSCEVTLVSPKSIPE